MRGLRRKRCVTMLATIGCVTVPAALGCSAGRVDRDPFADTLGGGGIDGDDTGDEDVDESTGGFDDEFKFDMAGGNADDGGGAPGGGDPQTCDEAKEWKTYIGCDFWPTVTANVVWPVFDFAVVVANAGATEAEVTVERGGVPVGKPTTIPANELRTIWLPWVEALKGPAASPCGEVLASLDATVRVPDGAYHLVSSRPVTVYQFNALEYAPEGGPPGKDWSSCPASQCSTAEVSCYSYSNDASLLLPSPSLTSNYRVTGYTAWQAATVPATITVTGTVDGTKVSVHATGQLLAGPEVAAVAAGGVMDFLLDRGEVVELVTSVDADPSGTLIQADHPVQVIFAMPCTQVPYGNTACDHVEESVVPAETLGEHYFVTVPTSPDGKPVAHLVRIYGNVDGTRLSYPSGKPDGFPETIDAGDVFEMGAAELVVEPFETPPYHWNLSVAEDFEIVGDHAFAVATFQFGAMALGDGMTISPLGDPSQSLATAVEQYRRKYVFLAPPDYAVSFVDVVQPMAAEVEIDGTIATEDLREIGGSGYGVRRVPLGSANGGAHVLVADEPVGIVSVHG